MSIFKRFHCPHSNLDGIYGDEINHVGGYRLWCRDCHAYLGRARQVARR